MGHWAQRNVGVELFGARCSHGPVTRVSAVTVPAHAERNLAQSSWAPVRVINGLQVLDPACTGLHGP
jgi:hypothetical protein